MRALICLILLSLLTVPLHAQPSLQLNRADYAEHLRGMWLAESIANWTGLNTEGLRAEPRFFTDDDWGTNQGQDGLIDFIIQDPWGADDDTDIEYVYLHLMNQHGTIWLMPQQIADGWREHINDYIWVSNAQARSWMDDGVLPPVTGMGFLNSDYLMIDAQLTTEFFGALAPGMPITALKMADMPIRTTSSGYASHAAQYFVVLYSLAPRVDTSLPPREQVLWLVREARKYIPDTSKTAGIVDLVLDEYLNNADVTDWESTRNKIYVRYQRNAEMYDFRYQAWYESSVNFATGLIALLYGEGDYRRTVQIGTLSGWDSDNGTATMAGLLGLLLGYDVLVAQFPGGDLSDRYNILRTRDNMPDYLPDDPRAQDTFTLMAERMLPLVEQAISESGGVVDGDTWTIPDLPADPLPLNPLSLLYRISANNQRTTTVSADNAVNIDALIDGAEHDFSGVEPLEQPGYAMFEGNENGEIVLTAEYAAPIYAYMIRLIEGAGAGGFTDVAFEAHVDGQWVALDVQPLMTLDPEVPFQMLDFLLAEPLTLTGIRLTATAVKATIAELDVLMQVG